jgi:carboxyl-terminal processing protease
MKTSPRFLSIGFLLVFVAVSLFAFRQDRHDKSFEIAKNLDIFATLYRELHTYYVDDVNPNQVMKTGIDAMLKSLDPYTNYIPEDQIEDYRTMTTGEYGGIGATVGTRNGKVVVMMPHQDSPAQKAGLKIGDEILEIDNVKVANSKANTDVSKLLKGQANTNVRLLVKRYGESQAKEIIIKRGVIKINNVPYYAMLNEEVGYIQLSDFTSGASQEVKNALKELKDKGAQSIVFDLRGNPGGLLNESVNISNLFINRDLEVVRTKGKIEEWNKSYKALNQPVDTDIPMVVLTNNRSASASEIVSGVLQDYDRAVLLGQRSFGKGLVQTTRPLSYNSQLKITTAKYYIPSGRCIQAIDYSSKDELGSASRIPDSLRRAFKTKKGRTVYDGAGLEPDIVIERKEFPPILTSLLSKSLIFDYANLYASKKANIAPAKDFQLSEAEYQDFVNYLKDKDYDYVTEVEKNIQQIEETAKKEQYYNNIANEIQSLKKRMSHNKEADLQTFKAEIKRVLSEEIVARYYFEKGQTEAKLNNDEEVKEAVAILKDKARYEQILQKKN